MRLLWQHRWLFVTLLEREIRSRYIGSTGGFIWALVHPLLLLGIYSFVFRSVFRVEFPELGQHPFVAFVAVALWPWMAFQEGVQRGVQAIQANAGLIRKVAFPHELLVYSAVAGSFVVHMTGFVLVLFVLSFFGHGPSLAGLPVAVGMIGLLFALSLGAGLMCAALQVFLRDIDQMLAPTMMVLFYATPILFPSSLVPGWLNQVISFNPLVHFIEPIRSSLLNGSFAIGWPDLAIWGGTLGFLYFARALFVRLSPHFEDFV